MPSIGADAAKLAGLQIDFLSKLRNGQITLDQFERFIRGEPTMVADIQSQLARWTVLYGVDCSQEGIQIPDHRDGFDRLIVVLKGTGYDEIFQKCAELFPTTKWTDKPLSVAIDFTKEQRDPNRDGSYAIWVRNNGQEPDRQRRDHSADQTTAKGIQSMTLLERLLFERDYYIQTGQHLDTKGVTSCIGSRYVGGCVPDVGWSGDRGVHVGWTLPGSAYGFLGGREVVPIQK